MSADELRDWSALPEPAVDGIVSAVVKAKRWTRDGPSMRAVNRQFCRWVSNRVSRIRPHRSRQLLPTDAKSLAEFPRATSVEVDRFCGDAELTDEDCALIMAGLQAMPALSHLSFAVREHSLRLLSCDRWTELSRLTSLAFANSCVDDTLDSSSDDSDDSSIDDSGCARHSNKAFLDMLKRLPVRDLVLGGWSWDWDLDAVLGNAPQMRTLSTNMFIDRLSEATISRLQALEAVSFKWSTANIESLSTLSALVEVGITPVPGNLHQISRLTQLKRLRLTVEDPKEDIMNLDCLSALSKMTSLVLRDACSYKGLVSFVLTCPLPQLEEFSCGGLVLSGSQFRDSFRNVRLLELRYWEMHEAEIFQNALQNIETLSLSLSSTHQYCCFRSLCSRTNLPKLSTLSIRDAVDGCVDVLDFVQSLPLLERLYLESLYACDRLLVSERPFEEVLGSLCRLTPLRELVIGCTTRVDELDALLDLEMMTRLEVFAMGTMDMNRSSVDCTAVEDSETGRRVRELQKRAPWLKLSFTNEEMIAARGRWSALSEICRW